MREELTKEHIGELVQMATGEKEINPIENEVLDPVLLIVFDQTGFGERVQEVAQNPTINPAANVTRQRIHHQFSHHNFGRKLRRTILHVGSGDIQMDDEYSLAVRYDTQVELALRATELMPVLWDHQFSPNYT